MIKSGGLNRVDCGLKFENTETFWTPLTGTPRRLIGSAFILAEASGSPRLRRTLTKEQKIICRICSCIVMPKILEYSRTLFLRW
jgi:hypothetical protein